MKIVEIALYVLAHFTTILQLIVAISCIGVLFMIIRKCIILKISKDV
jgi:hypothetical protein